MNPIVTRATGEEALEALHRLTPTASRRLTLLSLRTARMVLSRDTADMQELLDAALDQTTRAILSASEFLDATETILLEHTQAHFEIVLQLMLATLGPDEIAELAASDALWASIEMEALFCWSPCPSDRWVHANLPFIVVLEGLSQPDRQKPALAALTRHAFLPAADHPFLQVDSWVWCHRLVLKPKAALRKKVGGSVDTPQARIAIERALREVVALPVVRS